MPDEPQKNQSPPPLEEGHDYYFDERGLMVLTRAYLLKRGHCCRNGCRHCPYGYGPEGRQRDAATKPSTIIRKPTDT